MKYERKEGKHSTPDWVTFKLGAKRKTIAQLTDIMLDTDKLAAQIAECYFENDAGVFEAVGEGQTSVTLTPLQLDFVRDSFRLWPRDEALDPEA